jgi:hypothetical protein
MGPGGGRVSPRYETPPGTPPPPYLQGIGESSQEVSIPQLIQNTHHAEGLVDPKVLAKRLLILDTPEHVDSEN